MCDTLRKYLYVIIIASFPILTIAQTNSIASSTDSTDIKGLFEHLYKESNTYDQHKVIQISDYNKLKQNVTDSIRTYKKEVINHLNETKSLNNKLETIKAEVAQLKEELSTTQNMQNNVKLLGIAVNKKAYGLIMWGVIFCLAIISTLLFLMYKRGHKVVKEARIRLMEVQEDLEKHRKSAILREQALGNELMSYKRNHK